MIDASFSRMSRHAAVSGVYQYDTGQRLRMNGLPPPDELLAGDDLLTGDAVTVQAQFGYEDDSQTEMRLAQWDEARGAWVTDIPDEYLTRSDPVHVYVYVYHGEEDSGSRARTMYEGIFTPISRPAPNNVASDDMLATWAALEDEVDLVLTKTTTATGNTQTAASGAQTAAQTAKTATQTATTAAKTAQAAADRLEDVEAFFGGMTVVTKSLATGANATATISGNVVTLGLPKGTTGAAGAAGADGADGPTDITLSYSDGVLTITPT